MLKLYCWIMSGFKAEDGAAMVEYGILLAGIALIAGVAVYALGPIIAGFFEDAAGAL